MAPGSAKGNAAVPLDFDALCAQAARTYDLTRREEKVLLLLIQGKSPADVAEQLVVSPNTVKTHIRNLYRKLGINRREDLSLRLNCTENDEIRNFGPLEKGLAETRD